FRIKIIAKASGPEYPPPRFGRSLVLPPGLDPPAGARLRRGGTGGRLAGGMLRVRSRLRWVVSGQRLVRPREGRPPGIGGWQVSARSDLRVAQEQDPADQDDQ